MKRYRLVILWLAVVPTLCAMADNVVTLPTVTGSPGEVVTVSVGLANDDAVSAMQLQVPLDGPVEVVDGSESVASRAAGHRAAVGVKDGVLNVMVWSIDMSTLAGNRGEVLTFGLRLGTEPATLPLQASRVTLTDPNGNPMACTATAGVVTIAAPKVQLASRELDYGHIPIRNTYHQNLVVTNTGNVPLTISGIASSVAEFGSETAFPYVIAAGATGTVDVTYCPVERGAIVEEVRLLSDNVAGINTVRLMADPFAVNELHVGDAAGIADSTVTISLQVNNMDALSGFQMEFDLPEQLEYEDSSFALSDRKGDHRLLVTQKGQHLTAIAYSLAGDTFAGDDGEIASFRVRLNGRYGTVLNANKVVLSANYRGEDLNVCSDTFGGYVSISSPVLNAPEQYDMGATPVTEAALAKVTIRNRGNAPLRVDRVLFDTVGFTLAEPLPLFIEPHNSVDLHVSYDGLAEQPFHTLMQLYSNDPDHRLHNITVTGSRFAPNYLTINADDTHSGDPLLVEVSLSNYDPIDGVQMDVEYPSQWFEPSTEFSVTDRANSFSAMWHAVGMDKVRFFIYSLGDAEIAPGNGPVFTLRFDPVDNAPTGDYALAASGISLGVGELRDKYAGGDVQCVFSVTGFLPGDVNGDGQVGVADLTSLVNVILDMAVPDDWYARSDVNGDDQVGVADLTTLINMILEQ